MILSLKEKLELIKEQREKLIKACLAEPEIAERLSQRELESIRRHISRRYEIDEEEQDGRRHDVLEGSLDDLLLNGQGFESDWDDYDN